MKKIIDKENTAESFGNEGYNHVMENFSFQRFSEKLDKSVSFSIFWPFNSINPAIALDLCCKATI